MPPEGQSESELVSYRLGEIDKKLDGLLVAQATKVDKDDYKDDIAELKGRLDRVEKATNKLQQIWDKKPSWVVLGVITILSDAVVYLLTKG